MDSVDFKMGGKVGFEIMGQAGVFPAISPNGAKIFAANSQCIYGQYHQLQARNLGKSCATDPWTPPW